MANPKKEEPGPKDLERSLNSTTRSKVKSFCRTDQTEREKTVVIIKTLLELVLNLFYDLLDDHYTFSNNRF